MRSCMDNEVAYSPKFYTTPTYRILSVHSPSVSFCGGVVVVLGPTTQQKQRRSPVRDLYGSEVQGLDLPGVSPFPWTAFSQCKSCLAHFIISLKQLRPNCEGLNRWSVMQAHRAAETPERSQARRRREAEYLASQRAAKTPVQSQARRLQHATYMASQRDIYCNSYL
ncbi:hypothetical protein TNCV_3350791 [Trichonephila clavipes]|nr:hypothetical protein TNCV_3350791 [Trichonephila clavipes]